VLLRNLDIKTIFGLVDRRSDETADSPCMLFFVTERPFDKIFNNLL
jgi:hypothetical protein